jgi:hypothetical protein
MASNNGSLFASTLLQSNKVSVAVAVCSCISGGLVSWYPIPIPDLIFAFAYTIYIWSANAICFNSNRLALARKRPILTLGQGQYAGLPAFRSYMICFQIATVLIPLFTICIAPAEVAGPAVSPLVLLLIQVANESSTHEFHDTLRILVPIGFNTYRLKPLLAWVTGAIASSSPTPSWHCFGVLLAVVNLAMWAYNLFIFLLLRTLPVYFDKEYTPVVEMAYTVVPVPVKLTQKPKGK